MASLIFLLIVAIGVPVFMFAKRAVRDARRKRLLNAPFPSEWENILKRNIAIYPHLPAELKKQLHGDILIFLAEKLFEGCEGLEITDEIKVTLACQACMLLLNRETKYYPTLQSILVYPGAYQAEKISTLGSQRVVEPSVRLGESWHRGEVVLAWDHALHGGIDFKDGHNVVLHEFAHQLDQEDGLSDGAPILNQRSSYVTWARIMSKEYEGLRENVSHHKKDVMDAYGATNPAEFFAVATETFFEKPKQLKQNHPDLYDELKWYYKLDPFEWLDNSK